MIIAVMVEICHPLITSHEPKFEVCIYQRYSIGDYGKLMGINVELKHN